VSKPAGEHVRPSGAPSAASSDEDLVREARAGRTEAFDALVERYQRRATAVALRLVGDLHDALEICQEAFVRAYRNLETLEDARRFGSWLLRIVTNLSLNFRRDRAAGARRKVSFEDCLRPDEESAELRLPASRHVDERPGAELAARELAEVTQRAIAELGEQQRTALVLFSIEQLPQKQVAEIMGCSVEAVKWHVFQARRKLKERLAAYL
jgi:RNA polymerase sigma-70 factor (ECF subfamily)